MRQDYDIKRAWPGCVIAEPYVHVRSLPYTKGQVRLWLVRFDFRPDLARLRTMTGYVNPQTLSRRATVSRAVPKLIDFVLFFALIPLVGNACALRY